MDGVSALMSSPGQKGSHYLTLQGGTHVIPQRCRQVRPDGDNGARARRGSSPCAAPRAPGHSQCGAERARCDSPDAVSQPVHVAKGRRPLYRDRTCHGFAGHSGSHLPGTPAGGTVTVTMRNGPSPVKISRGADLVGIRLGSARRAMSSAHRATAPCARAPPWPPPRVPGWGVPRRPRRGSAGLRRGSPRPAPSHCPPGRTGRLRRAPPVSVR
jgi:hypothetical protein